MERGCEVLLGKMLGNKGLEISYLKYAQSFGDLIGCVWEIRDREILLSELIKVWVV